MGVITEFTKWEDISEYVLVDQFNTYYSLSPQSNTIIKTELLKQSNFNIQLWNFKVSAEQDGMIGLQFINNGELFITSDINVLDQNKDNIHQFVDSPILNNLMAKQINSQYNLVKWGSESKFIDTYSNNTESDTTVNNTSNNFNTEITNRVLPDDISIRRKFIQGSVLNRLYIAALNSINTAIVMDYFLLVKKKNKLSFMREYLANIKLDPNFTSKILTNKFNNSFINEYCCDNKLSPECSSIYFNESTRLNGKLFYTAVLSTKDNTIKNGYMDAQFVNLHKYPIADVVSSISFTGSIKFPTNDKYTLSISFVKPIRVTLGSYVIVNTASISPVIYNINTNVDQFISLLIEKSTHSDNPINITYTKLNMVKYEQVPAEWIYTQYYYDIMQDYNEYISKECVGNWSNCYNLIKANNFVLKQVSDKIIADCKESKSDACVSIFNKTSPNFDIKKAFCIQDDNYLKSIECNSFAKDNKDEFKKLQINYCTNDKKVWDDATCQDYIMNWYPNDKQFYDAYCLTNKHYSDGYDTCVKYYGIDVSTGNGREFVSTILDKCTSDDNVFKTCISNPGDNSIEYLNSELRSAKIRFCNKDENFNNQNCIDYTKEDPTGLDDILIRQCINYPTDIEPCNTVLSPDYNKINRIPVFSNNLLTTKCVDHTTNKFIPSIECISRNVLSNPATNVLQEPISNYCKDNITSNFCKDQFALKIFDSLSKPVKSGFTSVYPQISFEYDYLFLFLLLIIVIVATYLFLRKKRSIDLPIDKDITFE